MNQKDSMIKSGKWSFIGRDFILAWSVSMISGICLRMMDSVLASYATYVWASKSLGGYLTTFFTIGSVVMAFFSGRLTDIRGRRNCLITGCLMYAVPAFLMVFLQIPQAALICRLVQGTAKGLITVAGAAVIADVVPHDHMNRGMGIYGLSHTLSYSFGPMLGLAIVGENNFALMFAVCGIFYLVGSALSVGIRYETERKRMKTAEEKTEEETADDGSGTEYKGIWKLIEKKAILPSINFMLFIGSYACIVVFLMIYSQEILGLSSTQMGLFFTMAAIAMVIIRLFCSKWADRYGALVLLVPGHLALIGSLLLLAFAAKYNFAFFLISGFLYGVGNSAVFPGLNTVAMVDSPKHRGGQANATYYFMMDIGMLLASAAFGVFLDHSANLADGYRNMFVISAGITAVSFIMSVVLFNNKSRARRNPLFARHLERVKNGILDI